MRVRDARPGDTRAVEQVRVDGWLAAYGTILAPGFLASVTVDEQRVARREAALRSPEPNSAVLVAEDGGRVVGAAALLPCRDDDLDPVTTAELATLYVAPAAWSLGIGGRLLEEGFGRLPHPLQVLWTLEANAPARRFYERHGFVADGGRHVLDLGGPAPEVRYRRARP